jgi:hypothetical protein
MDDTWWLQHIFGLSLAEKTNPEAAKVADEVPPGDALGLMTRIFTSCGDLLASFTDKQVAEGLSFLGWAGESDWMYYVYDPAIDRQVRYDCVRSIEFLYRHCFARRCRNTTAHTSSDTDSLNSFCYMWWDRFPGGSLAADDAEQALVDAELIAVMTKALQIEHVACQESALHGLGHWHNERTERVIDEWLASHQDLPADLLKYARAARTGNAL